MRNLLKLVGLSVMLYEGACASLGNMDPGTRAMLIQYNLQQQAYWQQQMAAPAPQYQAPRLGITNTQCHPDALGGASCSSYGY